MMQGTDIPHTHPHPPRYTVYTCTDGTAHIIPLTLTGWIMASGRGQRYSRLLGSSYTSLRWRWEQMYSPRRKVSRTVGAAAVQWGPFPRTRQGYISPSPHSPIYTLS